MPGFEAVSFSCTRQQYTAHQIFSTDTPVKLAVGNNTYSAMASSAHASEAHRKTFKEFIQRTLGFKHFLNLVVPSQQK